jgi:alpha-glucosidase
LTQEGIHGNEEFPSATHNVTLPFTRMINGAADYTICYYDKRLNKTTHAHQLAASLVFYSPLETIFWYDTPSLYNGEPEIEWFDNLLTVFDDSKVISGYPGRNITIARRNGDVWFIGAMTGDAPYHEEISLDFLNAGKKYLAQIYSDDDTVETATKVRCTYLTVDSKQNLKFDIAATGGVAIRLIPVTSSEARKYKKYNNKTL